MRLLRVSSILIVLWSVSVYLSASPTVTLSFDSSASFTDLVNQPIPRRSQASFGGGIISVGIPVTKRLELSLGFTLVYTTRSIIYEHTFLRPSIEYGPSIGLSVQLPKHLFLAADFAYLFYAMRNYEYQERRYRFTLKPSYQIITFGSWGSLLLSLPSSVEWSHSMSTLSTGLGIAFKAGGIQ